MEKRRKGRHGKHMSKPIYLTEAMKQECLAEMSQALDKMNLFDGKIKYSANYYWPQEKDENGKPIPDVVTVIFSKTAKRKQDALIREFATEIGWHGFVRRDEDDPTVFYIDDIAVFPQEVTGASIRPDQFKYERWEDETLTPEQRASCRYHGHSHVSMSTSPSGTDDQYQMDKLSRLRGAGLSPEMLTAFMEQNHDSLFYIFMIWNKRGEVTARVFDVLNNRYYSGDEVIIKTEDNPELDAFLAEARAQVTTPSSEKKSDHKNAPAIPEQSYIPDWYRRQYGYGYDDYKN